MKMTASPSWRDWCRRQRSPMSCCAVVFPRCAGSGDCFSRRLPAAERGHSAPVFMDDARRPTCEGNTRSACTRGVSLSVERVQEVVRSKAIQRGRRRSCILGRSLTPRAAASSSMGKITGTSRNHEVRRSLRSFCLSAINLGGLADGLENAQYLRTEGYVRETARMSTEILDGWPG